MVETHVYREIIEYLADSRFHRKLWLPPNAEAGRPKTLRLTYSDLGNTAATGKHGQPVVLFCGGMFMSRYMTSRADEKCKELGLRLITVDKPGMGGSGPVKLECKVKTWLDTVPCLLKHLGIQHVALISHSCGSINLLNTLLYHRDILYPPKPYAAVICPWVHPSRSGATTISILKYVPDVILNNWQNIPKFINANIAPVIGFSSGISSGMSSIVSSGLMSSIKASNASVSDSQNESNEAAARSRAVDSKIIKYVFAESIEGVGQDAMLCMKRGGKRNLWGPWEDHDEYVELLKQQEDQRTVETMLRVEAFWADSDRMIGKKGAEWFDICWRKDARGNNIEYSSRTVESADHETIMDMKLGPLEEILERVAESFRVA